jgi:hypothetical protein
VTDEAEERESCKGASLPGKRSRVLEHTVLGLTTTMSCSRVCTDPE